MHVLHAGEMSQSKLSKRRLTCMLLTSRSGSGERGRRLDARQHTGTIKRFFVRPECRFAIVENAALPCFRFVLCWRRTSVRIRTTPSRRLRWSCASSTSWIVVPNGRNVCTCTRSFRVSFTTPGSSASPRTTASSLTGSRWMRIWNKYY